jgi:GNAT superfamily N-acetyltransferase
VIGGLHCRVAVHKDYKGIAVGMTGSVIGREVVIRRMAPSDVNAAVRVHIDAFKGFFLSFLGHRFLCELYHGILDDYSGIGLVAECHGDLSGFVIGSSDPVGLYRRMLVRRWWRFGAAATIRALRYPETVPRLFTALRSARRAAPHEVGTGLLMSVAVNPSAHGAGIGRLLLHNFLSEALKRGLHRVVLTTDALNNDRVNRFYTRFGFALSRTFTTGQGRAMNEYEIALGCHDQDKMYE